MTALKDKRPAAIRVVIPFVFRHWLQQPGRAAVVAGGLLGATAADLFMPIFSGRLVDALTLGTSDPAARRAAFAAFGGIVALGLAVDDPAPDRPAGDRAVHAEDHVRRVARRLHARAALLDRLARQQLCGLDRAQGHARHVGARPAQRHHPDGAGAVAAGAAGLDDPARAALARARRGHRGRHRDLRVDDAGVLGELHRPGRARLQCMGHQGRRHAGGCADLQRGGEILRRGSARGRAAGRRHRPVAHARAADLAALQLHLHGAARGAAVLSCVGDRRRGPAVDRGPRHAGRRHLCADQLLHHPCLSARRRHAHQQPAAFGQRHGGTGRDPWRADRHCRCAGCEADRHPGRPHRVRRGDVPLWRPSRAAV